MSIAELTDRLTTSEGLENLLREIAPEDFDGPLYVALQSEGLPEEFHADAWGYASASLDLALRDWLGDRWNGRGPAIVLNDRDMRRDSPDAFGLLPPAVALHEAAHALEFPVRSDATKDVEPEATQTEAAALAAWCASPSTPLAPSRPWIGHDWRFLRVLLHLIHRAERLTGIALPLVAAYQHLLYGVRPAFFYRDALGNEPGRLARLSLAEVRATRPPEAFGELWESDTNEPVLFFGGLK